MPKTAGASFGVALQSHFRAAFRRDDDLPINTTPYQRQESALHTSLELAHQGLAGTKCIHGHFLPIKYLLLGTKTQLTFVTWLRNPIDRLVSHYAYWWQHYDSNRATPLFKRVVEEKWSLERFCLSPEFRNLYCQFLWGFPLEYFHFIGITEFYAEDLSYFSRRFLGTELPVEFRNTSDSESRLASLDSQLRQEIDRYHAKDVQLYQRALKYRQHRQRT